MDKCKCEQEYRLSDLKMYPSGLLITDAEVNDQHNGICLVEKRHTEVING